MTAPTALLQPPGHFTVETDGSSNAPRWTIWLRRFTNYLTAAGIKTEAQLATFLNLAGDDIDSITQVLAKDKTLLADVEAITAHFESTLNADRLILDFRQAKQRAGEGIEAFGIRLRTLSSGCAFDTRLEQELKLQLAAGASNPKVMRKAMEATQTWSQLYDYALSLEKNEATSRLLNIPTDRPVKVEFANQLLRSKSPTAEPNAKCGYCAKRKQERGERCPARGKTCAKCGIANHFEAACRQVRAQPPQQPSRYRDRRQLNQVNVREAQDEQGQRQLDADNYYLFAVQSEDTSERSEMPRIAVDVLGTSMDMGIDTQASLNAISKEQYEAMANKPTLRQWQSFAFSYDGTTPMKARSRRRPKQTAEAPPSR